MKNKIIIITLIIISLIIININFKKEEKVKSSENLVSIIIEKEDGNEKSETFPSKENYYYEKVECNKNSDTSVIPTFNEVDWKLNLKANSNSNIDGNFNCTVHFKEKPVINFKYTGSPQTFTVPISGTYKIELWGSGNSGANVKIGKGSYTSGLIKLEKNENLYVYVGGEHSTFNGGMPGGTSNDPAASASCNIPGHVGNSATDVRLINGEWDNDRGLRSRIIVAGAGGASITTKEVGDIANVGPSNDVNPVPAKVIGGNAHAGGLSGYEGNTLFHEQYARIPYHGTGGSQTLGGLGGKISPIESTNPFKINEDNFGKAGTFGKGGLPGKAVLWPTATSCAYSGIGGSSGYYGSGGSGGSVQTYWGPNASGGGSSFISGHTGCVAITSESDETSKTGCIEGTTDNNCSIHYSKKVFTNTIMIDGAGNTWTNQKGIQAQMPKPTGDYYDLGYAHSGNGYAKISFINKK